VCVDFVFTSVHTDRRFLLVFSCHSFHPTLAVLHPALALQRGHLSWLGTIELTVQDLTPPPPINWPRRARETPSSRLNCINCARPVQTAHQNRFLLAFSYHSVRPYASYDAHKDNMHPLVMLYSSPPPTTPPPTLHAPPSLPKCVS